jgi:hypothetical protein
MVKARSRSGSKTSKSAKLKYAELNGLNKRFDIRIEKAQMEIELVNRKLEEGYPAHNQQGSTVTHSAIAAAAIELGISQQSLRNRVGTVFRKGLWERLHGIKPNWDAKKTSQFSKFSMEHETPPLGTSEDRRWELVSNKDNTFRFAAFGDFHAASKYCRPEVREDLTRRAEAFGAQCIFDTGNWIDGEARFNRYDLEVSGLDGQCRHLAKIYPKTKLPTYAIAGADHEGWYVKSEGVDVGRYCESVMREMGHKWTNLGYMQADIVLVNANTRRTCILRDMHAGGGSAYALSYRPQKIVESFEGGDKPAVLLIGHYHKLDAGLVRNVFYAQTGCGQDQTPFMAQKAIEAHVGGVLIEIEQDPETGAIISYMPQIRRYYNRQYYFAAGKANNRWSGHGPVTQIPRRANQP